MPLRVIGSGAGSAENAQAQGASAKI